MELFDLCDAQRRLVGRTIARGEKLPRGLYHQVVHVAIFHPDGRMLIQHRQTTKRGWPDLWDISAGGAVQAGEDSPTAAMRETWEELGLQVDLTGRRPAMTMCMSASFDDIYLLEMPVELAQLQLQPEEVQDAALATEQEILRMIRNGRFVPYRSSYIRLLFDLNRTGRLAGPLRRPAGHVAPTEG